MSDRDIILCKWYQKLNIYFGNKSQMDKHTTKTQYRNKKKQCKFLSSVKFSEVSHEEHKSVRL